MFSLNPLCSSDRSAVLPQNKALHSVWTLQICYTPIKKEKKKKKVVNSRVDSLCVRFLFRCVCSVNFQLPLRGGQTNPRILLSDQCDSSKVR